MANRRHTSHCWGVAIAEAERIDFSCAWKLAEVLLADGCLCCECYKHPTATRLTRSQYAFIKS